MHAFSKLYKINRFSLIELTAATEVSGAFISLSSVKISAAVIAAATISPIGRVCCKEK